MIVFPNAKINIGLNVMSKRIDGFHNLESIFYPIPWFDVLEIIPSNDFKFTTSGLLIKGNIDDNLIVKAFKLIKNKYNIKNCHIHLHKQIPMGAGLGGGSADASFTLVALNQLFNLKLSQKSLEKIADSLGSDCAFFIENTPKYVSGKGEVLKSINLSLKNKYIKLVNPNIHVNTANAFKNIETNTSINNLHNINLSAINQVNKDLLNSFENTVFKSYPILSKIKNKIKNEGSFYASMTGTGATIYGLYNEKPIKSFKDFNEVVFKL